VHSSGISRLGYARALVTFLAAQILAAGKTPFLHVKSGNGAKVVYQKIGFRLRAEIWLKAWLVVKRIVALSRIDLIVHAP
jgi:hypothetical protein